ncbi:MAG: BTAD domain-containing putative transcriptional regulator, partial [Longimicrobiales bacterium]
MLELRVLGATDLRRTDGIRVHSVLAQPKRFALLAYLLVSASGSFVRRDVLLALFWPESDDTRARASLRKAIHYLRSSLGADLIVGRGSDELAVDTGFCDCDALQLRRLLEAERLEEAVGLYAGELLPGFHIDGAPAFDQWLEAERASLRRLTADAAATLARRAQAVGEKGTAAAWQRRAHEIAPDDEDILRAALVLLIDAGQRSAALELLAAHRKRFDEIGIAPDGALDAPFARAPHEPAAPGAQVSALPTAHVALPLSASAGHESQSVPASSSAVKPPASRLQKPRGSMWRWGLSAAAAIAVLLALWQVVPRLDSRAAADAATPLVAVGAIRDFTAGVDSVGRLIPDLLATNLARAPRLRVVSAARLHEIAVAAGDDVRNASAVAAAARVAHANELVEGAVYRLPDGRLRLDLRRLRLTDGQLLDTYRVTGSDPFELVDRATATLALDIGGVGGRRLHVADVTTRSLVALRFYQEGLTPYFSGDPETAAQLFDAALEEDSTFAMAAYFAGLANISEWPVMMAYLQQAERLAHRTTDRERLLIRTTIAFYLNEPAHLAFADSLVARYPDEPAAHVMYGRSLMLAGRFAEAMTPLRRALHLDSLALGRESGSCHACGALLLMGDAYLFMDSADAAERTLRRAYAARASTGAFAAPLANALQANGKYAEANEYLRRAGALVMPAENVALR